MAGRASIVGAAVSNVGNVRTHNEDSHFLDAEEGLFVVCDGMGGHAAGEVASALAVAVIRDKWTSNEVHNAVARWHQKGSAESRKVLIDQLRDGVMAAHQAIMDEAARDDAKTGMGTTLVGAIVVGGDCVFAHAGDSRAYLVRDGIAMQLTEDHTLLARLMAAGVEVDTTGEGSRFKSMLTNALGIGPECKVSTFVVPLADGDRFLLCSDGITEYVPEAEVGEVLTKQASPARAAQKLVDLALERGGSDNATALVVRVLEAGERPQSSSERKRDESAIAVCPLYAKLSPQQRLRALRIALPREYAKGEKLPAQTLGDRVAWLVLDGEVELDGARRGAGTLVYPESLDPSLPMPDRDGLWLVTADLRALALRSDDFREICADDEEIAEVLLASLGAMLGKAPAVLAPARPPTADEPIAPPLPPPPAPAPPDRTIDPRAATDPDIRMPVPVPRPRRTTDTEMAALVTDTPAKHAERDQPVVNPIRRATPVAGVPVSPPPAAPAPPVVVASPPPLPPLPPVRLIPSVTMPSIAMPPAFAPPKIEPEHLAQIAAEPEGEGDLEAIATVIGPPPTSGEAHESADLIPADEVTPPASPPLTLDLDPLPEIPTDVTRRPTGSLPVLPEAPESELALAAVLKTTSEVPALRDPPPPPPMPLLELAPDRSSGSFPIFVEMGDEPTSEPVAPIKMAGDIESLDHLEEYDLMPEDLVEDDGHARAASTADTVFTAGSVVTEDATEPPAAPPTPETGLGPRARRLSDGWE